jgi:hypothetical protein
MHRFILSIPLLIAMLAAATAQVAIGVPRSANLGAAPPIGSAGITLARDDTRGTVLPPLPLPPGGEEQRASDYLKAAQGALAAGRTAEAQQALEMAQTRILDRSVPLRQTNNPSDNPTVMQISQALQALTARDRATCMQLIQTAIGSASAQGL